MINLRCSQCNDWLSVPDSLAGAQETCPSCGNVCIVPQPIQHEALSGRSQECQKDNRPSPSQKLHKRTAHTGQTPTPQTALSVSIATIGLVVRWFLVCVLLAAGTLFWHLSWGLWHESLSVRVIMISNLAFSAFIVLPLWAMWRLARDHTNYRRGVIVSCLFCAIMLYHGLRLLVLKEISHFLVTYTIPLWYRGVCFLLCATPSLFCYWGVHRNRVLRDGTSLANNIQRLRRHRIMTGVGFYVAVAILSFIVDISSHMAEVLSHRAEISPDVASSLSFNAHEARRRQVETAAALGVPVETTLDLGGGVSMELVLIPAGRFVMGSPSSEKDRHSDEGPQRVVTITKPFYMGVYEVTQAQFEAVMGGNPSSVKGRDYAVHGVWWDDANSFCSRLSKRTGKTVRLPTEAEWEYACRAGTTTRFYYGDDPDYSQLGKYAQQQLLFSFDRGYPVGQKRPNAFGLYDMHGNVYEWCSDWYAYSYARADSTDPTGPASGTGHVRRSCSWGLSESSCRSAYRSTQTPGGDHCSDCGLRVVVLVSGDAPIYGD